MSNVDDLLPFVPVPVTLDKDKCSTFRLFTTPGVNTSTRYDFVVAHLDGTEKLREILTFVKNIDKLAVGTNRD